MPEQTINRILEGIAGYPTVVCGECGEELLYTSQAPFLREDHSYVPTKLDQGQFESGWEICFECEKCKTDHYFEFSTLPKYTVEAK